jgi:hypothetical protein
LCKTHGYKSTGTKDVLISRLLGKTDEEIKETLAAKESSTKKPGSDPKKPSSKQLKKIETSKVVEKLTVNVPSIILRKNRFNNYEHAETGFIFDKNKLVIGKQNDDGTVDNLTEEDIDRCNAYKFKLELPENLDEHISLKDVKIDELDDELDEEKLLEIDDENSEDEEDGDDDIEY